MLFGWFVWLTCVVVWCLGVAYVLGLLTFGFAVVFGAGVIRGVLVLRFGLWCGMLACVVYLDCLVRAVASLWCTG